MNILVTGGAGYIGSVVTEQLIMLGNQVVVFDNFSQGHQAAVHPGASFEYGDLNDYDAVKNVFNKYTFDAVMHFASNTLVVESVTEPMKYVGDNVINGIHLFKEMIAHQVQRFVLSSTANLFDQPDKIPIDEQERIIPGSPYAESKYILERILYWLGRTLGMRYGILRYFNACGASQKFGEDHNPETHLIPLILQVAARKKEYVEVFGNDYPTPDGTCIRDYIHVVDLAQAHILTLQALDKSNQIYNLGNGKGFSVREVVNVAQDITGKYIPTIDAHRRSGDPAVLVANSDNIKRELGWSPKYTSISDIIESAWRWHLGHPNGYES